MHLQTGKRKLARVNATEHGLLCEPVELSTFMSKRDLLYYFTLAYSTGSSGLPESRHFSKGSFSGDRPDRHSSSALGVHTLVGRNVDSV